MTALPVEPDSELTERAHSARRQLTPSQIALVDRLIEAAADEAHEHGYEGTTVRSAARRAGMAPATAYTYFASKDHLLAEVLWRRMADLVLAPPGRGHSTSDRVVAELRLLGTFMSDDLELAAAGTTALLAPGPDVGATRLRLGQAINDRLATALGDDLDPTLLRSLNLIYTGAVVWMGMGHLAAADVPDALEETGRLLMGTRG